MCTCLYMYVCMYVCMYGWMDEFQIRQLSPAPVGGFGLELAVDYLYSEPERAVSP